MAEIVFDYAVIVLATAIAYAIVCYGRSLLMQKNNS